MKNYIIFNSLFLIISLYYNFNWYVILYNYLTNFHNNYIFILNLLCIIILFFFNKIYYIWIWMLIFFKLKLKFINIIALHNSLFVYHPISLYITLIILFCYLKHEKKIIITTNYIIWVSFILGGYWASQEFNWGGWWNWDSLEMGILFTLIYFLFKIHLPLNTYLLKFFNLNILFYFICYWMFNKLGLTISIHAFVKNNFFYKYINFIYIFINFYYTSKLKLMTIILLIQLKFILINVNFFKFLFSIIFLYYFNYINIKYKIIKYIHKIFFICLYLFSLLNINNLTFYKITTTQQIFNSYSFTNYKILIQLKCICFINSIYKDFFFFKFFNFNILNFGWNLTLFNIFSNSIWVLIFIMLKKYTKYYTKLHKKRIFNKSIITFNYINNINILRRKKIIFIYFYKTFFIKFKFFRKLRKLLKKKLKKKYLQIFFFCKPNFLIHEKFKNARMGKGKGSPTIWIFQPNLTHPTFIFKNFSIKRAFLLKKYIQRYFNPYLLMKLV